MPTGFLSRLDDDARGELLAAGRERRYRPGEALCREGEATDDVVVILSGWAKVVATAFTGHEVVLSVRGPGDLIGELAAVEERRAPRSATVEALEPVSARLLTGEEFRSFLGRRAGAGLVLLQVLSGRLRDADRRRVEFGGYDTAQRLAKVLVELASENGHVGLDGVHLGVALTQEELAGLVAASRESVARALGTLRSRSLVATGRRRLVVLDLDALREFAGT